MQKRLKESLAIIGIAAAAGGAYETGFELDANATAAGRYATAVSCGQEFDAVVIQIHPQETGSSSDVPVELALNAGKSQITQRGFLTKRTLDCLKAGDIVPGAKAVDTSDFKAGESESALYKYAIGEKKDSEDFDPTGTIIGFLGAGAAAAFVAGMYGRLKKR